MQQNYNKKRKLNKLKASLLLLMLVCFAGVAQAQTIVKMKNGNMTVPSSGYYLFYDSGGEHQQLPVNDPSNDYNWVNMYQHNETYELTFTPNSASEHVGVKVTFEYVNINNDWLKIYQGTSSTGGTLIAEFTGDNDYTDGVDGDGVHYSTAGEKLSPYENNGNKLTVQSNGPITFRFEADDHWRDHGWRATVQGVTDVTVPTPPVVLMQKCANALQLFQTCVNSSIYYAIGYGTEPNDPDTRDPLSVTESYNPGDVITLSETATYPVYVKAIAKIGDKTSSVVTYKFEDALLKPTVPTLELVPGTSNVHITTAVYTGSDTYYVRYTTNGDDPTTANPMSAQNPYGYIEIQQDPETKKVDAIITITEPCTLQAVKRGTSCPENFSDIVSLDIETVYVPAPVITIAEGGSTTISCSLSNATIKYTKDGSDPRTSTTAQAYSAAFTVTAGTTVKAYAFVNHEDYEPSPVVTEIYVPASGSGVYGTDIVLLDDREDHNMTYYQKATDLPSGYPTAYLSSPDPRNVKITYKGGSVNNASAVAISALDGEGQNEMIYLKTVEKTVLGMSGNYPYTVISNPFSKRPRANNTTGTNGFYGFAGWKVISGGEYIQEYNNDDVLPLDATIHFTNLNTNYTPNCLSADVVFEATWTQATVYRQTSRPSFSGGTYETNFWVLSGNANNGYGGIPANCTMSARYPDGTSSTTNNFTRSIYPRGDNAKVEFVNIALSGGGYGGQANYVSAEGYTFTVGRGVTLASSGTARALYACTEDQECVHTVKIESGTYSQLRHFADDISADNDIDQLLILGCDYDRARAVQTASYNTKLVITGTMYVGASVNLHRTSSDTPYVRCYIKSGNFNSNSTVNSNYHGLGDESYYFSVQGTHNAGRRYLVVEGGHLRSISGGMDDTEDQTTTGRSFDLRVRGTAQIDGAVYGAAEFVGAKGARTMVFTGGNVDGWIAGGCNGTATTGGKLDGDSYIYVGGKTNVGNENGGNHVGGNYHNQSQNTYGINGADGGNVFGAGCGILTTNSSYNPNTNYQNATYTVGKVNNSNVIVADDAIVWRDVYGGGNYGQIETNGTATVSILKGTIKGNVYGGSNNQKGQTVKVNMSDGSVDGNIYGGSNTWGTIANNATINISGGSASNVFGGGYGTSTVMSKDVTVNISGGTIINNVYGGGSLGAVGATGTNNAANTVVNISGGTMKNVYGAGLGTAAEAISANANIYGNTTVIVSGGTVSESVYGGGENGAVAYNVTGKSSLVTVSGGTIGENVYGGGNNGFTNGPTTVNIDGGTIEGSVFGGAFGKKDKVYVAGRRTVNMRGGTVNKNVYGGSRNADDALAFNPTPAFSSNTTTTTASVVNFAGGHVYYQVFASGYFGKVFGSTYAFIGENAIMNAPNHTATGTYNAAYYDNHEALQIDGSVWAGGDFGNYDGTRFGDPTITGNSCIYVDGSDYDTQSTSINNRYMNIGGSLYGCGTSCDAGKGTRQIIVREYGDPVENPAWNSKEQVVEKYSNATRSLYSIQRADYIDFDNAHINLLGQGKINSLVTTEHYSIHEFGWVRVCNGSSLFLNAPADQIVKFGSYSVDNVYKVDGEPTYTKVVHAGSTSTLEATPNKIRVNGGAYIMVHHDGVAAGGHTRATGYGELEGFAYMMTEGENETMAYARPRQGTDQGNTIPNNYDNPNDGGWVSYNSQYNTFFDSGTTGCGTTGTGVKQMPYENHTAASKNGEAYFRVWRYGTKYLYREGVLVAQSDGTSNFSTTDVTIPLSAPLGAGSYFRIKSLSDGNTTIDYGADVMMVNAACYGNVSDANWMYIDGDAANSNFVTGRTQAQCSDLHYISDNPNVNFGLVAIPQGSIASQQTLLICETSDAKLAQTQWANTDQTANGGVLFRLTYNNAITNNVVWEPITIVFEHVLGNEVKEEITVELTITTLTNIEQDFTTEVYAVMRGDGTSSAGTYTAKVVLPQYIMNVSSTGEISEWTCLGVEWNENSEFGDQFENSFVTSQQNPYLGHNDQFAMTFAPGLNYDQTTGWDEYYQGQPLNAYNWSQSSFTLGKTTARDPIAFDFTLQFDKGMNVTTNDLMGTLTFHMHFTNYANGDSNYEKDLDISIKVYRIGVGAIYYLDGVHGNNLYSGLYPNAAKKSLSGIFNRTNYRYGDYIFVVNTVTAEGNLEWNGKQYQEVTLLRYPGRHELADYGDLASTSYWEDYDKANNGCFTGPLVKVGGTIAGNMTMNAIVLDGFHDRTNDTKLYPQLQGQHYQTGMTTGEDPQPIYTDLTWNGTYVNPDKPLVEINQGSTLTVYGQSKMTGNYNKTDNGGAINNAGTLNIYDGSEISDNAVIDGKNGGGVYLALGSTLQLSDLVTIDNNHLFTESGSKAETLGVKNNVYLPAFASTVTVGTANTTDPYTSLDNASRIGITSIPEEEWIYQESEKWYLPVAFSDGGLADYLQNIIDNGIIFDDKNEYDVVSLNNADWVNNPTNYLYFVGTWVTVVTEQPADFDPANIDSREDLAWAISYANGYNNCEAHPNAEFTLTADLDMNAHIWVPIGSAQKPFGGKFHGNGHVVTGLRSPLNNTHMGMFGITEKAEISDLVAKANFAGGTMKNLGTFIGTMNGGKLYNVEAAGTLVGTNSTLNMGGLVGQATKEGANVAAPVIHSGFAVNEMTGGNNTVVGGLVGTNGSDLYNSYANVTLGTNNTATTLGGLVGINQANCTVENCYVINPIGPAFAATNNGVINYCYAANGTTDFVGADSEDPDGHGTYDAVKARKAIGYLYDDNAVTAKTADTTYVRSKLTYNGKQIATWPGLVSTLNQWVAAKSTTSLTYTPWFRPTSGDINGDLPILGFPSDNSLATEDGKFLHYGSNVNANGLDNLFETFAEKDANMFLYGNATDVTKGNGDNMLFINEDAVLTQAPISSKDEEPQYNAITATVGVTFDNSDHGQNAYDYYGNKLKYDWHFMSTPLADALTGATYSGSGFTNQSGINIDGMTDGYFPNGLNTTTPAPENAVKWDFYTYYEPHYHWINLKRGPGNHWHTDGGAIIPYVEDDNTAKNATFVPGKGYMMAISQDSYMSNSGVLNNGNVPITLTNQEPQSLQYNKGWNLVGNPYQAYLDLKAVRTGANASYYIYDAESGDYVPYAVDASQNTVTPSRYIHPHQGFFMYSASDNNQFSFTQSMATTEKEDGSYFRGDEQINYPLVNLFARSQAGNNDLAIIELNRPEIGGATKMSFMTNANFELSAYLDGQDYGLLFTPEGTEKVPVHFTTQEDGTYTLTWDTQNGVFTSLLLVDNMTGTITDMLRSDHYTFDAKTSDYASRFYLTYACTGVEEVNEGDGSFAFFDGSEWVVNGKGQLDIIDVTGRVLFSKRIANEQNRVNLNNVAPGVYMMRVSDGKDTMVQKIVVR